MKRKSRKAPAAPSKVLKKDPDALLALARSQTEDGRFRDAVATYKELLKVESRPEWRLELAAAYGGRARDLLAKGMPKEALVVWENRAALVPGLAPDLDHLALLLRVGQVQRVLDIHNNAGAGLDGATLTFLRSHLAALHLGGESAVAMGLADDDPILVQGLAASRALDAYCAGDDPALRDALRGISFRSPYRDLAQILKALQRWAESDYEAAADLLLKVTDDSGFAPLRRACDLAPRPHQSPTNEMSDADDDTRRFALTLAGWSNTRQSIWEEIRKVRDPSPQTLLGLLHRHRGVLGEGWARRKALPLLLPGYPKSRGWITRGGGRRLSEDEDLLLRAWRAEQSPDAWAEIDAWAHYARYLMDRGDCEPGSDEALRIALVLRRTDSLRDTLSNVTRSQSPEALDRVLADYLKTSLDYDPEDSTSYERLIRYALRGKDLKFARGLSESALKRFPADVGLLTAAMDLSLAGDAFKKAAGYARQILRLDPINTGARERLIKAHLAHARKQVRARRLDLARGELGLAAQWDQDGRLSEQRGLLAGLLDLIEDRALGEATLRCQIQALGGGMAAAFALALESIAIGRPVASVLRGVGLGKIPVPNQMDLAAFLRRLRTRLDEGLVPTAELRRLFQKPLSAAARWPLAQSEYETACETLSRAGFHGARLAFAQAALKAWPGVPIFVLHAFEARHKERKGYASNADLESLDTALALALESGDQRTAHRIREILTDYLPIGFSPSGPVPFAGLQEPGDDAESILYSFIEAMGIDGVLDAAGFNAKDKSKFKKMARDVPHHALMQILAEILGESLSEFAPLLESGPGSDPFSGPDRIPKPKSSPGPRRKRPRSADPDGDDPGQFELF